MKKLLYTLAFIAFALVSQLSAQTKMVVSEYFNVSGVSAGEWVELLVIEDNVSIVGFYVRDNSGDGVWQGGFVFKDVPLWRNLRKGTVLLVSTRGFTSRDVDPSDGFIDIDAQNTSYFDRRVESGVLDGDNVLNLNQITECVQLLDNFGNHHHALAQSTFPLLTAIAVLPNPKVVHEDASAATSVRFWGFGGGAYNQPSGTDSTTNVYGNVTKGFANQGATTAQQNVNQRFWRALRQPQWNSPKLNPPQLSGDGVKLTWNAAVDPNPSDKIQGYLVLRHLASESGSAQIPEDARLYPNGSMLGSSKVLANIDGSNTTEYLDNSFECGKDYIYRTYAYRYTNTGDDSDNLPLKGRGRSYNEISFAELAVKTPSVESAELKMIAGAVSPACTDEVIKISAKVPAGNYTYEWQANGTLLSQEKLDTITVVVRKGTSRYKLILKNELGCVSTSNEILIEGVDKPNPYLARIVGAKETKYTKDETVTLCLGEKLKLNGTGGSVNPQIRVNWFRNGVLWNPNISLVEITESGEYYFVATNQGSCPDTSYRITAVFNEYNYSFNVTLLSFPVDLAETFLEKDVILTNNANSPLVLTKEMVIIASASGFTIVSPATFPVTIPAKGSLTIKVRFTPPDFGVYRGRMTVLSPCGNKYVTLEGFRDAGEPTISAGNSNIYLGKFLYCSNEVIDSVITVTALGNEKISVLMPTNSNADFTINYPDLPFTIDPLESFTFNIELTNKSIGLHQTTVSIPYKGELQTGDFDTLHLNFSAEIIEPKITLKSNILDLGILVGCQATKDTTINVMNNSGVEITINEQPSDSRIVFNNLPIVLQDGESAEIELTFTSENADEDFTFDIEFEPCGSSQSLRIKAKHSGMIFTLDEPDFDFGTIMDCGNTNELSKEFNLSITNINPTAKVELIINTNSEDFEISGISTDQPLTANTKFTIKILNPEHRTYSGIIELVFEPCGNSIIIPISGEFAEFAYNISNFTDNKIDFGTIAPGTPIEKSITITNNSKEVMILTKAPILNSKFVLVSPDPSSFPMSINSNGGYLELKFAYTPDSFGAYDSLRTAFELEEPCLKSLPFDLIGRTVSQTLSLNARLELPAVRVTAEPGDLASFTLSLFSKSAVKLDESEVSKLKFNLNYNPTLLFPKQISALGSMQNNVKSISMIETSPGKSAVTIEPTDMTKFLDGEIAKLDFTALLGNSLRTNVTISNVEIESPNVVLLETTVAEFEIIGECSLESRLVQIGEMPGIIISNSNDGTKNIFVSNIVDGILDVSVYNLLGNKVGVVCNENKKAGTYNFNFNSGLLPAGVYHVVMQYEGGRAAEKMIIE